MRTRFPAALGVVAITVLLAACGSSGSGARSGGGDKGSGGGTAGSAAIDQLNVRTHAMYGTLDPGTTQNCFSTYCSFFYERLLKFDENGKPTPQLALRWTTPDPKTYEFKLRQGVKFWNGHPLTADDVANSLNYERNPKNNSSIALKNVEDVTALAPDTVRIALKSPDSSLPSALAASGVIFEKAFQQQAGANFGKPGTLTMATGPFKIDSFNGKDDIQLSANPTWWGGKVNVKKVAVKLIPEDTAGALAIRSGSIDVGVGYGDPRVMESSLGNGGKATKVISPASIKYISLNTKLAPLDDIHVRRAIAYATDRQGYIDASGGGKPLYTIITPIQLQQIASQADAEALVKSLPATTFDVAKAQAEMAQSKYPNGFSTEIHCPDFGIAECQVMAAQLGKIGIKLKASQVPVLKYINETQESSKHPFVYGYIGCTGPDPSGCLGYLLGKDQLNQLNSAQYDPPGMDALVKSGVTATDPAKRFSIYGEILKKIADDVPYVTYQLPVYTIMLSNKYEWPAIDEINSDPIFYTPWILNLRAKS